MEDMGLDSFNKELEALAKDIDDVVDPSSYDEVLIHFEKIEKEAEEFIELLVTKLKYREITWGQPWYQGTSALTKPHVPFYARNETETEKFRTDKMTKDEHDRICKNWKRFTKKYDVPDKIRLFVSWKNHVKSYGSPKECARRFVAAYLARGLERTLQQVFTYIQSFHLRDIEKRVYNEYEQKIMEVCFMHQPEKAPIILSMVLGRQIRGIYKRRIVATTEQPEKIREKWTLQRAEKLLKGILEYSNLPLDELKYKIFDKTFWLKLQEKMNRPYGSLHFFWYCYLHVQLFVKCDIKLYKLRRKLFKILRDSSCKVWNDIRWANLVEHFPDGVTKQFLVRISSIIVQKHKNYSKVPLPDLANFALQRMKSYRYTNKRLKRLTVNNEGNLEVIKFVSAEQNS